jgi:membrane protein
MEDGGEKNAVNPATDSVVTASIWKLGGLSWRDLARRVWLELYEGKLLTHAAALSFYFLLSLFPLLLFLITLLGFSAAESGTEMRSQLLTTLSSILPRSASALIYTTVDEIVLNADGGKLSFGLLTALWLASSGVVAIGEALNAMYGVRETRPWWKVRLSAMGLTVALALLVLIGLGILFYAGGIGKGAVGYINQYGRFDAVWGVLQVALILAFVLIIYALIYYFTPDLCDQKWYWITPGSIAGVALWLLVSYLFRLYLSRFDSYSLTYGSLGTVIILMMWFYLTGVALLLGGKINAEIENAAAKAGFPEAKHHGEKTADE